MAVDIPAAAAATDPAADRVLRRSTFVPGVGAAFAADRGSDRYTLRLVEVLDLVPASVAGDEHAFNLVFEQTAGQAAPDGIYTLSAARVPGCSLYLSSVERPRVGHRLQALVNRRFG